MVLGVVIYRFTSAWLLDQIDQSLLTTAEQIGATIQPDANANSGDGVDFQFQEGDRATKAILQSHLFFVRLINQKTGAILETSAPYSLIVSDFAQQGTPIYETLRQTNDTATFRVYTLPLSSFNQVALQIGQSLADVQQTQAEIIRLLVMIIAVTAALAFVTGLFLANRALVPVRALTSTAQSITEKDLHQRVSLEASDSELHLLVATFNGMLERLEQAFQRQSRFTADAAHELRTPLSVMQTGIDVILSEERNASQYRSALVTIQEEVERLTQLTIKLLTLARADSKQRFLERYPLDLALLLNTVLDQLTPLAEEKRLVIKRHLISQLMIVGDEGQLIQMALNLIENAIKYTPSGREVHIHLYQRKNQAYFTIDDTGLGIPVKHLPHLFERFYRVDSARNRNQGGFGLGLPIAQEIARLHGGEITVASKEGVGSQFTVTLPIS